jgi:inorganic pyrophosphatase
MLGYWFSVLTMKSVGLAAMEMVNEVARRFEEKSDLLKMVPRKKHTDRPDSQRCVAISTKASLCEMTIPSLLVIVSPIRTGAFFDISAVCVLRTGGTS